MLLFTEYTLKGHTIKNRVVMPPMVCFGFSGQDGYVTQNNIDHYRERAKGGTAVIIVEATCIAKDGRLSDTQLGIWSDEHIWGLSKIADVIHQYGSLALIQIHHAGFKTPAAVNESPLSASQYDNNGIISRSMTLNEINEIQAEYVNAALRAEKAGFDGIELHGAHGYLISQFASPITNKRTDEYGGSLENRIRFAKEIILKIKERVSKNFIIGYRMGGNEPTLDEGIQIAGMLEAYGVDLLHVSAGMPGDVLPSAPEGFPNNWIVYMGTEVKKHVSIPVIVVNGIRTPTAAEYLINKNLADFVAIGKGILADPNWTLHAQNAQSINACKECKRCMFYSNGSKCPNNSR
ncbi:MAG: tRNA-dihydrouridine synthase [Bacillota bacterium]